MKWFVTAAVATAILSSTAGVATPSATLWVVQPPCVVVAVDPTNFERIGEVRIPAVGFDHPERVTVNGHGQILVVLDDGRPWVWDSGASSVVTADAKSTSMTPADEGASRQWLLGGDGKSLFEFERKETGEAAPEWIRLQKTDLRGRPTGDVFNVAVVPGRCTEEPVGEVGCPEATVWAPGGVVDSSFLLDRWEAGDAVSGDDESRWATRHVTLYCRAGAGWTHRDIEEAGPVFLDATQSGSIRVEASTGPTDDDEGSWCEGAGVILPDTSVVLSDECARLPGGTRGASIGPDVAAIAPGGRRVAATMRGAFDQGSAMDTTDGFAPDTAAIAATRRLVSELPVVDVYDIGSSARLIGRVPNAELVGWASDEVIVVVADRRLVAVDVTTGTRRPSGLEVRSVQDARIAR